MPVATLSDAPGLDIEIAGAFYRDLLRSAEDAMKAHDSPNTLFDRGAEAQRVVRRSSASVFMITPVPPSHAGRGLVWPTAGGGSCRFETSAGTVVQRLRSVVQEKNGTACHCG